MAGVTPPALDPGADRRFINNVSNKVALARVHDAAELERFRAVQRLCYRCAEEVAGTLEPGVTEREACRRMRRWLREHGVDDWLHTPFAWFGDRSAFRGFRVPTQFLPGGTRLEEGMPYILDMAPVKDGYSADIGYGGVLGENRIWERLDADLAGYRALILGLVRERRTFADVYAEVDALIERQGYDSRHREYPGRVIGHQVGVIGGILPKRVGFPFGVRFLQTIGRELVKERLEGRSPLWNGASQSQHPRRPGCGRSSPTSGSAASA